MVEDSISMDRCHVLDGLLLISDLVRCRSKQLRQLAETQKAYSTDSRSEYWSTVIGTHG